jgi:hypothetical protein
VGLLEMIFNSDMSTQEIEEEINKFQRNSWEIAIVESSFSSFIRPFFWKLFLDLTKNLEAFLKKKIDRIRSKQEILPDDKTKDAAIKFSLSIVEVLIKLFLYFNKYEGFSFTNKIMGHVFTCFSLAHYLSYEITNDTSESKESTLVNLYSCSQRNNGNDKKVRQFVVMLLELLAKRLGEKHSILKYNVIDNKNSSEPSFFERKDVKYIEENIFKLTSREEVLVGFSQIVFLLDHKMMNSYYHDNYNDHLTVIKTYTELLKNILADIEIKGSSEIFNYLVRWNFNLNSYFCIFNNSHSFLYRSDQDIFVFCEALIELAYSVNEIYYRLKKSLCVDETSLLKFLMKGLDFIFVRLMNGKFPGLTTEEIHQKIEDTRNLVLKKIIYPSISRPLCNFVTPLEVPAFPILGMIDLLLCFENPRTKCKDLTFYSNLLFKFYDNDTGLFTNELPKEELIKDSVMGSLSYQSNSLEWLKPEIQEIQKLITLVESTKDSENQLFCLDLEHGKFANANVQLKNLKLV